MYYEDRQQQKYIFKNFDRHIFLVFSVNFCLKQMKKKKILLKMNNVFFHSFHALAFLLKYEPKNKEKILKIM